jgi:hypothetical protein
MAKVCKICAKPLVNKRCIQCTRAEAALERAYAGKRRSLGIAWQMCDGGYRELTRDTPALTDLLMRIDARYTYDRVRGAFYTLAGELVRPDYTYAYKPSVKLTIALTDTQDTNIDAKEAVVAICAHRLPRACKIIVVDRDETNLRPSNIAYRLKPQFEPI